MELDPNILFDEVKSESLGSSNEEDKERASALEEDLLSEEKDDLSEVEKDQSLFKELSAKEFNGKEELNEEVIEQEKQEVSKLFATSLDQKGPEDKLVSIPPKGKVLSFKATKVDELPRELKKITKESKIPTQTLDENFQILLFVLHFVTKKVYIAEHKTSSSSSSSSIKKSNSSLSLTRLFKFKKDSEDKLNDSTSHSNSLSKKNFEGKHSSLRGFFKKDNKFDSLKKDSHPPFPKLESLKQPVPTSKSQQQEILKSGSFKDEMILKTQPETSSTKHPDKTFLDSQLLLISPEPDSSKKKFTQVPVIKLTNDENVKKKVLAKSSQPKRRTKVTPESLGILKITTHKDIFKNIQRAGKGGFGNVYTAQLIKTNEIVAIKKMKHRSKKDISQNYSEIKYMKHLSHPNIVKYISSYEYKEELWLLMEYLDGGTLSDARAGHEFKENEIAYVAKELLQALNFIHNKGIVHRDVKSPNIMMSVKGEIKLIDFGLSTRISSLHKPSMVGSPHWMAPEMICRYRYSYPVDIWSFGISLLELANKHPPWMENKVKVMFEAATLGRPNPLENPQLWSNHFQEFMAKCLQKDPFKRETAAKLLQHPFLNQAVDTKKMMQKILSEVFLQKALGLF